MSPTLRIPTPPADAFAWYTAALAAPRTLDPPQYGEEPQPGFYKRRFDRRGVFVPARIWLVQIVANGELIADEKLVCEIGGDRFDPFEVWISLCEHPITKAEFDHMMRVRDWARTCAPDQPEAAPMKPVDFFTVKPPQWGKRKRKKQR